MTSPKAFLHKIEKLLSEEDKLNKDPSLEDEFLILELCRKIKYFNERQHFNTFDLDEIQKLIQNIKLPFTVPP
jgi:hypothetical protein